MLTGQMAPYLEFYEFMEDRVLIGVPDFVPREVVDGALTVLPSRFGDFGEGRPQCLEAEDGPRHPLPSHRRGRPLLHAHDDGHRGFSPRLGGMRLGAPAPQLPSLEVILDGPVEDFAQQVMSQHYIIAYGDATAEVRELCVLLGIEVLP